MKKNTVLRDTDKTKVVTASYLKSSIRKQLHHQVCHFGSSTYNYRNFECEVKDLEVIYINK